MSAVVFGLVYFEGDSWHDGSWELSCPEISVNKWDKTAATERRRNQLDSLVSWGALDYFTGGYRLSGQRVCDYFLSSLSNKQPNVYKALTIN